MTLHFIRTVFAAVLLSGSAGMTAFAQEADTVCLEAACSADVSRPTTIYDVYDDLREVETGMAIKWAEALHMGNFSESRRHCIEICDQHTRARQEACKSVYGQPFAGEEPHMAHARYTCLDVVHYEQMECLQTPMLNACADDDKDEAE